MKLNPLILAATIVLAGHANGAVIIITPTGVTSSSATGGYGAVNTINGNSLNSPFNETATHGAGSGNGSMWLSAGGTGVGQIITFNLGSVQSLTGAYIWNYNQDNQQTRGFLNFDIYVGTSSEPTAPTLVQSASILRLPNGSGVARPAEYEAFVANNIQYVRFVS
jgi:hypothetical protein